MDHLVSPPRPDLAQAVAAMGLRVFPVDQTTSDPREQWGLKCATSDPNRVWEMWRRFPRANVALATGPNPGGTGFDVVHITGGPHGGTRLAHQLNNHGALDGWAMVARHPDGGLDIYYPADQWEQPTVQTAASRTCASGWAVAGRRCAAGRRKALGAGLVGPIPRAGKWCY